MFSSAPSNASQNPGQPKRATPSIISADVVVTGLLHSRGDMQIDGRVDGNVRGQNLVIGEEAVITGEIEVDCVVVRGKIEGSIRAKAVTLAAGCHVMGDIIHETLEVEFGAFLQGQVRHCVNPLADLLPTAEGHLESLESVERRRPGSPMRDAVSHSASETPGKIAANG